MRLYFEVAIVERWTRSLGSWGHESFLYMNSVMSTRFDAKVVHDAANPAVQDARSGVHFLGAVRTWPHEVLKRLFQVLPQWFQTLETIFRSVINRQMTSLCHKLLNHCVSSLQPLAVRRASCRRIARRTMALDGETPTMHPAHRGRTINNHYFS
jgi:hypothetical protein